MTRRSLGHLLLRLCPLGRSLHVPRLVASWDLMMILKVSTEHLDFFRTERTFLLDLTLPEIKIPKDLNYTKNLTVTLGQIKYIAESKLR